MKGTIMGWSRARRLGGWAALPVLLVALGTSGCSSYGNVSGTVTHNKQPVKGGTVTFVSSGGKMSPVAQINEDGTYTVRVPAGDVVICVDTDMYKPLDKGAAGEHHYSPPSGQKAPEGFGAGDSKDRAKRYVAIPPKYKSPESSPFKYTVASGSQTKDLPVD
jgi:hypothetical protein